ncbi:MAG: 4-(cytidine 5'-diphospho)-2-C-methyl-D-erythritol kinase [Deltaproteobacteria bacterium]|jgi:4-diphosphocytidyl-2-C-methyl-D-erythritol kinase|nr:4-(cytidine 5'-diphospho)-2-C-methyl-D-erythritol kinase [Deltaproteobacteria bacterium]
MENITYYASAKINFSLRIGRKETVGLHKIHSLMRRIGITDKISFKVTEDGYRIKVIPGAILKNSGIEVGLESISNENNIVIKAAKSFFNKLNIGDKAIDVLIEKNIPFNAGLGGGSSDGAGLLLKLNEVYNNILDKVELRKLALETGSDMPFFLEESDAIVSGFGENVEKIEAGVLPKYYIVLIIPDFGISTKDAYADYDDFLLTNNINYYNIQYLGFKDLMFENDFESVIFKKYPILKEIKESLSLNGAETSLLSGSGSAIFGAFKNLADANSYIDELKSFHFYRRICLSYLTETL